METRKNECGFATRRLTICKRFFDRVTTRAIKVPELRLNGKWLAGTVFGIGKRVEVNYVDEKLVISLAKEQPECVKNDEVVKDSGRVDSKRVCDKGWAPPRRLWSCPWWCFLLTCLQR